MSFADILPYLAGGLAGAAVPGLGRGAGQAMSMQQAFENQEKRDARYDDETAYRRGRDTAGDTERQSDRLYRRGRDTVGDLERKDDKAYSRGRNAALDAERTANTQWSQDFSEEGRQIQGENRLQDVGFRERAEEREISRMRLQEQSTKFSRERADQYDSMQLQKHFIGMMDDMEQKAQYKNMGELINGFLPKNAKGEPIADMTGMPPNAVLQLGGMLMSGDEDAPTSSELMDIMIEGYDYADRSPEGSEQRKLALSWAKNAESQLNKMFGVEIGKIRSAEQQEVADKKIRDSWFWVVGEYLAKAGAGSGYLPEGGIASIPRTMLLENVVAPAMHDMASPVYEDINEKRITAAKIGEALFSGGE